jgi:glycosyltransferase involved in cell wall biosynthesis
VRSKPKVAWVYTDWNTNEFRRKNNLYGGIGYYRVVAPARVLGDDFDITLLGANFMEWGSVDEAFGKLFQEFDLVYSKHVDNGKAASNMLAMADYFGKPVIVDIDDNYRAIREDNPAFADYDVMKGGRYFLGAFMSLASGLTVSTQPLAEAYADLNARIDVLPNCCDLSEWTAKRKRWRDGKIRIGYAGSVTHGDDLALIYEPIGKVLDRNTNVVFEIVGSVGGKDLEAFSDRVQAFAARDIGGQVEFYGGTPSWQGYPKFLASFGWDIGIAPLVGGIFNECKSHIKWLEYSAIGIPTVASPVYPYRQDIQGIHTIQDGKTGFFAANTDEWVFHLQRLVDSALLRSETAGSARSYIAEHWQYRQHAGKWRDAIQKYL